MQVTKAMLRTKGQLKQILNMIVGNKFCVLKMFLQLPNGQKSMSGMGAYAGAARRRVHFATVLLRHPSDHRPDRRQARHAHILQIGLHLTQP